jgi:hypothetical protein
MKKIIYIGLIVGIFSSAFAEKKSTGVGVYFDRWGTALNLKHFMSGTDAFDVGLRYNLDGGGFAVNSHYILHNYNAIPVSVGKLPFYYGIGGYVVGGGGTGIGAEGVIGLAYEFTVPADIFFQIQPVVPLVPAVDFDMNFALGGRFWF